MLLFICLILTICAYGQNSTEVTLGTKMTGALMNGVMNVYWVMINDTNRQSLAFDVGSSGANVIVKYGSPPTGEFDFSEIESFCAGDCYSGATSVFWPIQHRSLACPLVGNVAGLYYIGLINTYRNTTYSITVSVYDPLLTIGVARQYVIDDVYSFYVANNSVAPSTNLELHQKIVHQGSGSGTSNSGLVLKPWDNCQGNGISPYLITGDDRTKSYVLTPNTVIKNTDPFWVSTQCGYAFLLLNNPTGLLEPGNSFCIVACASGTSQCSACDGFDGASSSAEQWGVSSIVILLSLLTFLCK